MWYRIILLALMQGSGMNHNFQRQCSCLLPKNVLVDVVAFLCASVSLLVKYETACLCHDFLVIRCFEDEKY